MGGDACAPAQRHPIEPPHFRRGGDVHNEQQHHDCHIGEGVHREPARMGIDEDACPAVRSPHPNSERMSCDPDAPASRNPDKPKVVRRQPQVQPGTNYDDGDISRRVNEESNGSAVLGHGTRKARQSVNGASLGSVSGAHLTQLHEPPLQFGF